MPKKQFLKWSFMKDVISLWKKKASFLLMSSFFKKNHKWLKYSNEEDRDDTVVQDLKSSMFFYYLTSKLQTEFPSQWFLTVSPRFEEKVQAPAPPSV